jgi:hypothetical protein
MTHAWCSDPSRDEAVRAAEDGRTAQLPTLEECIERQKQTARPCGGTDPAPSRGERGAAVNGMRTERITLEVTHNAALSAREWRMWRTIFDPRYGESVRVVSDEEREAALPDVSDQDGDRVAIDWQGLTKVLQAERDAANRERDEIRQSWLRSEESGTRLLAERNAALDAADGLRKQVAELKDKSHARSVSMNKSLSELAETRCERDEAKARVAELEQAIMLCSGSCGFVGRSTQAASGGGEGEVANVTFHADDSAERARYVGMTVKPLRRPQPRGWLTEEERDLIAWIVDEDAYTEKAQSIAKGLLSRSTPPEVVLPMDEIVWNEEGRRVRRLNPIKVREALTSQGVLFKEAT